jgi:prepilin signal peptidase PulO-like enzyme (type II secretory pathway)
MAQALVAASVLVLAAIAVIDVRTLRAPNTYVVLALLLALAGAVFVSAADLLDATMGALVACALLLVVALAGRGAMGFGDVKYGAACGGVVGISSVLPMLLAAFLAGAAVALVVLLTGFRSRRDVVAFTPFLLVGVLFALVAPAHVMPGWA